jgi:geranyl-CoA carboxylase alpha subunit
MFDKILIANRGEIAVRIIGTAKELGFRTVAVFSEADKYAPHVTLADEAVCIGESNVNESYLVIDKLIAAAKASGANAIHPGYGFLSENADFARTCHDNNICFIGPSADAIELMGCKRQSKIAMLVAGVPCIPGYEGSDQTDETLIAESLIIGFPLMVKAAKGGGGRGMRLVTSEIELKSAIKSARSEAKNAFGSGELIIEKAISDARHIEIQIFADSLGNTIHLAERDCSVQRRHQKVIEEAPSMVLTDFSRKKMGDAAILAAKACNYVGAGTVEFLYDDTKSENNFYFLEMNTRLQVEHPVTELVTGLNLVELQLNVANGEALPITQEEVTITGHAMEVRLYAEDPANNFMPQTGKIHLWQPPLNNAETSFIQSQQVTKTRIDSGITQGQTISAFYDPMLAKLICYGDNREQARRRLLKLVQDTQLLGVRDNRAFLSELLNDQNFIKGQAKINFIADQFSKNKSLTTQIITPEDWILAATLFKSSISEKNEFQQSTKQSELHFQSLHTSYIGQQLITIACDQSTSEPKKMLFNQPISTKNEAKKIVQVSSLISSQDLEAKNNGSDINNEQLEIIDLTENKIRYLYQGVIKSRSFTVDQRSETSSLWLSSIAGNLQFFDHSLSSNKSEKVGSDQVTASMDGLVVEVLVNEGDQVNSGDVIAIIEAMKMEHLLKASVSGHVEKVLTTAGTQVKSRQLLVQLKQSS